MDEIKIKEIAKSIVEAERNVKPIGILTNTYKDLSVEDAYKIQQQVFTLKEEDGEKIIGKKIGLTSEAIREQIGVYEPDFSFITDKNVLLPGETLKLSEHINPKLEPELVFYLNKDLKGTKITNWDIIDATEAIYPAFEVVDTRYGQYNFTISDTIADSASYGKLLLGNKSVKINDIDLDNIGLSVYKNGKLSISATSAEVMGNPINSVVWLANKMIELGYYLKKGDVILSGSFTPVLDIFDGDYFEAKFAGIGNVGIHIEN